MADRYRAPLHDIKFVLNKMIRSDQLAEIATPNTVSPDLVNQILESAAKFAEEAVAPLNQIGDRQGVRLENGVVLMPDGFTDCYRNYVDAGWASVSGDTEYGGQGLPLTISIALNEIWQSANMSLANAWMLTQGAVEAIQMHGTPQQKATYLPNLISGKWSGTMNLTEPNAGSDVGALKTKAVPENGAWRITGTKIFITHGDQNMSENIIHLVLARTPGAPDGTKGISLFIVPKFNVDGSGAIGQRNDLRVVSLEHKLGHMASPTAVMSYGDNEGAIGFLLGEENQGMSCMFTMMNNARLNVAVQGLAIAERSYQAARQWAMERIQGNDISGKSQGKIAIIQHPDVRRMLMDMRCQTEAIRALCYSVAEAIDLAQNHPDHELREHYRGYLELMTPVAKAWSTDQGFDIASTGVQVHGGMGYIEETGASQYLRDARITMIYEGTNGIQALDLVRRKLPKEVAATNRLFEEISKTAADMISSGDPSLVTTAKEIQTSLKALREATEWMRQTILTKPEVAASGATQYCKMFGYIAAGWLLGRGALQAILNSENQSFSNRKKISAQFFAEQHLRPAASLLGPITAASKTVLSLVNEEV
jgi:alkylation response protein AidB-like acyl-CoA dehydrogenase